MESQRVKFHMAPLKEYPPGFCMAMAHGFAADFCIDCTSIECGTHEELPQSFLDLCKHMQDHGFGKHIGLD